MGGSEESGTGVRAPADASPAPQVSEGTSQVPAAFMAWQSSLLIETEPSGKQSSSRVSTRGWCCSFFTSKHFLALELMAVPAESCAGWPGALWGHHHCPQAHQSTCVLLTPWEELTHSLWDSIQWYGVTAETLNNILQQPH